MMNGSVAFSLLKRAENHVVTSPHILRSKHNKRHHTFSTNTKQGIQPKDENYRSPLFVAVAAVTVAVAAASASLYTRHLREQKLSTLVEAKDSELLSTDTTTTNTISSTLSSSPIYNLPSLIETVTRAGLIGSTKSVKDELHVLRDWHTSRGYNGGIVVRDLSRPLFSLNLFDFGHETNNDESEEDINGDDKESFDGISNIADHIMNRRECYYLYYEIHSNGETRQQLFCRGTTLLADVLTCLQTWFVYDEELGCRVHHGFNQHANRIVEDVMPLLVPPPPTINNGTTAETMGRNYAATVEVCGHSLGGAVAMLVAIKLRKRGYFVTRVTSLAGPRFCRGAEERDILQKWLPKETIRIEDDLDIVSYLPLMGVSVGDKLWFAKGKAYLLPKHSLSGKNYWTESVWLNLRLFETILNQSQTHRVISYINRLKQLVDNKSND